MSAAMELHVALSMRLDATEAYRLAHAYRAEVLRQEASNLRKVEREATPEGALGTRTGLLRAALILDERADAIGEKSSPAGADATPTTTDTARRAHLLHTITTQGGHWKSGTVARWYEAHGYNGLRLRAARHDLAVLRDAGALIQHDDKGVRYFTAAREGGRRA
jgi:DNA-binding transcriptional ArsR family regulator